MNRSRTTRPAEIDLARKSASSAAHPAPRVFTPQRDPSSAVQQMTVAPAEEYRDSTQITALQRAIGNRAVNRVLTTQTGQARRGAEVAGDSRSPAGDPISGQMAGMPVPGPRQDEYFQGRAYPTGHALQPAPVTQRKAAPGVNQAQDRAPARRPNMTGLPDNLKTGIESLSGMYMDAVNVHYNSPRPAQLSALAYARGADIHVGPDQERHLPHEAWHVVQQAQGRVKPTLQLKHGPRVNDDSGLEREADAMGALAGQPRLADRPGPIASSGAWVAPSTGSVLQAQLEFDGSWDALTRFTQAAAEEVKSALALRFETLEKSLLKVTGPRKNGKPYTRAADFVALVNQHGPYPYTEKASLEAQIADHTTVVAGLVEKSETADREKGDKAAAAERQKAAKAEAREARRQEAQQRADDDEAQRQAEAERDAAAALEAARRAKQRLEKQKADDAEQQRIKDEALRRASADVSLAQREAWLSEEAQADVIAEADGINLAGMAALKSQMAKAIGIARKSGALTDFLAAEAAIHRVMALAQELVAEAPAAIQAASDALAKASEGVPLRKSDVKREAMARGIPDQWQAVNDTYNTRFYDHPDQASKREKLAKLRDRLVTPDHRLGQSESPTALLREMLAAREIGPGPVVSVYRTLSDPKPRYSMKAKIDGMTKYVLHAHMKADHTVAEGKSPVHIKKSTDTVKEVYSESFTVRPADYALIMPATGDIRMARESDETLD